MDLEAARREQANIDRATDGPVIVARPRPTVAAPLRPRVPDEHRVALGAMYAAPPSSGTLSAA